MDLSSTFCSEDKSPSLFVSASGWEHYSWLLNGFSLRHGGVSTIYAPDQPCGELNLGFTASDSRENVLENRQRLLAALSNGPEEEKNLSSLVTVKQIHSAILHRVTAAQAQQEENLEGDGLMTNEPGVILGIQTADCIPVLVADTRKKAVAAFHAGWRGTLRRIVENGVGRMKTEFGSDPSDLIAAIGPGIGQCCYVVGEEVYQGFSSEFSYADALFCHVYATDPQKRAYPLQSERGSAEHSHAEPRLYLDLVEANRRQLLDAGLSPNAISILGECTNCNSDRFFSYRAAQGFTGRMLSVIGIRK